MTRQETELARILCRNKKLDRLLISQIFEINIDG